MARPREFDRDHALHCAMGVFWEEGYASTSLDDLLKAMKIGRQSLYDSFGDKRRLYLEALALYQQQSVSCHIERLRSGKTPLAGVEAMLRGLIPDDPEAYARGCLGILAIAEFGTSDAEVVRLRIASGEILHKALTSRLEEARACGELGPSQEPARAATFIATTMQGLQVGARAGRARIDLEDVITFTLDALRR